MAGGLWASGCGADSCERLCWSTTVALARCLQDWSADWEDLGAENRASFRRDCEDDWSAVRAELEPREVRMALDACEEGLADLDTIGCDSLRVLYLEP